MSPSLAYRISITLSVLLVALGCAGPEVPAEPGGIVLMIGDGMGFSQIALARTMLLGPGERWSFETLPVTGIVSTWSASNATTDSGAASTAMASGIKTSNQQIGTDLAGEPVETIAEAAIDAGWRVGYVTSTAITHATPAAFYAHVDNRYADVDQIAERLVAHPAEVALGGGLAAFLPEAEYGERLDDRNLLEEAEAVGWSVWRRGDDLGRRPPDRLLGLFANDDLAFRLDDLRYPEGRRDPPLALLTGLALEVLTRSGEPFFLVVEGGRIDHASHSFDAATAAHELAEFDDAIRVVLDHRRSRADLLVLVTADHGTGGLAINDYVDWEALRRQRASVEWMARQIRNAGADVEMVREMTGFEDLEEADLDAVRDELDKYEAWRNLGRLLSRRNGVTWIPRVTLDTKGHTGEDVPIYAGGPGAERFGGAIDNTDIAVQLFDLLERTPRPAVP